ncbi:hypothetical protein ACOTHJ_12560 [Achromobacter xylosoxidans]
MSFLKKYPLPAHRREEKKYLEQLEKIESNDLRGLGDSELASLRAWLQERYEHSKHRVEQLDAIFNLLGVVFVASLAGYVGLMLVKFLHSRSVDWVMVLFKSPSSAQWLDNTAAGCLALIAFVFFFFFILVIPHDRVKVRAGQFNTQRRRLAPLSETGGCMKMLELVDEYPEVATYRDDVLRTGREILKIDLEIVTQLSDHLLAANVIKSHEAACRRLHGLPAEVDA